MKNRVKKHVDELLKLMTVLTGDSRFEEQIKEMHKEEGEVKMCEVLDKIENRGIEIGETRGRKIGEKLERLYWMRNIKSESIIINRYIGNI